MSGICGVLSCHDPSTLRTPILEGMCSTIRQRGPNTCDIWSDSDTGIALGNQRLIVAEPPTETMMPMKSPDGRLVMVHDGRLYNTEALRHELVALGHTLPDSSEQAVMLAAISQWGIAAAFKRFEGMFAVALWDRQERTLTLVRDRIGVKPLYYGWVKDVFLFGSQLNALRAHPAWHGEVNRGALALFLRYDYIPTPYSIYQGISKMVPGTFLCITQAHAHQATAPQPVAYWSAREVAEHGVATPFADSEDAAIDELERLLRNTIASQMVDTPTHSTFLSGGVDSSTVATLLQAQSSKPINTFTIGFHDEAYNEAVFAKEVARHLGTDHHEHYVTPEEAIAVIPNLPQFYDEPFSDASQIPTFLLATMVRQHTPICLSGDGADDLFGGHRRHKIAPSIWNSISKIPTASRYAMARTLTAIPVETFDKALNWLVPLSPKFKRVTSVGDRLHKRAALLAAASEDSVYRHLVSDWNDPCSVVIGAREPSVLLTDKAQWAEMPDFLRWMMYLDLMTWLPDDILVKVDRASMGVGLEVRMPFLERRIIEFAWTISPGWKLRDDQNKWLLRQVLYRYVPRELIERPKTGFEMPLDVWLRGPLREWAETLLDAQRLRDEGFFHVQPVRQKWTEHLSGCRDWNYHLWNVLMFQEWFAHQRKQPVSVELTKEIAV